MFGIIRGVFRGAGAITRTLGRGAHFLGRTIGRAGRGVFSLGKKIFRVTNQQINNAKNTQPREASISTFDRTQCDTFSLIVKQHPKRGFLKRRPRPKIKIRPNIYAKAKKRFLGLRKKRFALMKKRNHQRAFF